MVFFSSYELYKQGTSQVVIWLAKTAARCGYEGFANAEIHEATKQNNKKGNVKKSNKKRKKSTRPAQPDNGPTQQVSIKDLPLLAKVISEQFEQTSDLEALPSILGVLKDVISRRKEWAKNFGFPDPSKEIIDSNMRHKHFVAILEEVYQILGGIVSALRMGEAQKPGGINLDEISLSNEKALNNLFAILEIEESVDQGESESGQSQTPIRPKPALVKYELEEMDEEEILEEIYFRIYCFFKDFADMRPQISQGWADYMSGILDLPAVAVTMNAALEMLQRAETDLLASISKKPILTSQRELKLSNHEDVASFLYKLVAVARGVDPNRRVKADDIINLELKDIADFTCLPVYIILSSFIPVLDDNSLPVMKPGYFGPINMTGRPLTWREKFKQDKAVLLEFLPEFCILNRFRTDLPVTDELTHGLMKMMKTKEIPMWLVLGCQVYLDIHYTMLSNIGMAQKELQATGQHASTALQNYLDFSKDMSIDTWPKQNDQFLRLIKVEADMWINQDFFATIQKKIFKSANLSESLVRPYGLLSRHPLLCGLIVFRLNLRLQEAGVTMVCAWGNLPAVIHLYNAVKQEFPDNIPTWQDVEAVIAIQGKERIFVGDFPKDPEEHLKRFCLVMGYSASMFAPNRRQGRNTPQTQTPASKRGPRQMITTSSLADVFRGQYCEKNDRPDVTFHKIEKLLASKSVLSLEEKNKSKKSESDIEIPFISLSFLSSLQSQIQTDTLARNIDYFALHIRCVNLLRDIYVGLDSDFRKYFSSSNYMEKENQLPFLIGYLFLIATNSGKSAEILKVARRDEEVKSAILLKAGNMVKDLITKEGNREVERVRKLCRGFDWSE